MTFELPTEDNHFKAGFNPWMGAASIAFGILICLLALQVILTSGVFSFRILVGILFFLAGILCLRRPYFAIAPNRLTIYNLFGQVVKRYPFANFNNIEVENGRVYIRAASAAHTGSVAEVREPVKIRQWMTKPSDWKMLKRLSAKTPE